MSPSENFGHTPCSGERCDYRSDQCGAEHSETKENLSADSAQKRSKRLCNLTYCIEWGMTAAQSDRCGERHYDGDHDDLGENGSSCSICPSLLDGCNGKLFIDNRALLVKNHPWHDHGPDIGRKQIQI